MIKRNKIKSQDLNLKRKKINLVVKMIRKIRQKMKNPDLEKNIN